MRRGTTPTFTISTSIDLTDAEVIYLTFSQGRNGIFTLEKDRMEITSEAIVVKLTQEETLSFDDRKSVRFQIRGRKPGNVAVASNIMTTSVSEILKDGVI